MFRGWPTIRVDSRQASIWSRSKKWPAMGLRVEPPLLVIDIDVLDAELAGVLERLVPPGALRRIGRAPKVAFFLRLEGEPFYRIGTRRWTPDPTAAKPEWSALEMFGGGGKGKQFGAFGPHEITDKDVVIRSYQWPDGRTPANTPIDQLPVMSRDAVYALADAAERLFIERGWQVDQLTQNGEHRIVQAYDLTPAMRFEDGEESYSLTELEDAARAAEVKGGQVRVTGSFTGDPVSANSLRCRVGISHHGRVYVHDFKSGATHHPDDAADQETPIDFSRILKLMEESS